MRCMTHKYSVRLYAKVKVAYLVLVHISTLAFVTLYGFNDRFFFVDHRRYSRKISCFFAPNH